MKWSNSKVLCPIIMEKRIVWLYFSIYDSKIIKLIQNCSLFVTPLLLFICWIVFLVTIYMLLLHLTSQARILTTVLSTFLIFVPVLIVTSPASPHTTSFSMWFKTRRPYCRWNISSPLLQLCKSWNKMWTSYKFTCSRLILVNLDKLILK